MTETHTRPATPGLAKDLPTVPRIAAELLHVRRAFGEPIVSGEVTLVPVALVTGSSGYGVGSGSATGQGTESVGASSSGEGEGGGYVVRVRPLGTYVVSGSTVTWQPALDLVKVILGGQAVGAVTMIALAWALRRRRRRR